MSPSNHVPKFVITKNSTEPATAASPILTGERFRRVIAPRIVISATLA
jgi:hypothetical protein